MVTGSHHRFSLWKGAARLAALALATAAAALFATRASGVGPSYLETDLVVNKSVNGVPTLTDKNGIVHVAKFFDPNLVNPWGVSESMTSPFWVSDAEVGLATLYNTAGTPQSLVVSIPSPTDPTGAGGAPTGQVFNPSIAQGAFKVKGFTAAGAATTAPAFFLFATEDGTIAGWSPTVFPAGVTNAGPSTHAIIAVDNSAVPDACHHAIYKGLAVATDSAGGTFLYATNFRAGTIEVYDANLQPVSFSADAFTDKHLPHRYAPFNVAAVTIDGSTVLFVTYAVQDKEKVDDVSGQGHGIVNVFDLSGHLLRRFAKHEGLNSPWGVALAPATFGRFQGALLIGNFGDGRINAFDPRTGDRLGQLQDAQGQPIVIDGLWTLIFGNGGNGGDKNILYFTAGPNDEEDGLFGSLSAQP